MVAAMLYGLNSPCRECEERTPGCNCDAYKLYRKELDARKAKENEERNREATAYQAEQIKSANHKKSGKTKRKWRGI